MGKDLKGRELGSGIYQRKDGRYYARVTYKGVKISMYGKNFQELKRQINVEKQNIDNGLNALDQYTVKEWFEKWFDAYKVPIIKPQSVEPMKRKVYSTFLPYIGDMKLNELRSIDLQTALNQLLEEGRIAPSSISEALNRLRDCFASAVNNRYMISNPAFDLKVPFSEEADKERRWLTPNEIVVFLGTAKDNWWYEMLYVMIHTGLRVGEIGGLKWKDIHWSEGGKNGYIEVTQSLSANYKDGIKTIFLGDLKTKNSHRRIPFIKDVESVLRSQEIKINKIKQDLGDRFRAKGDFSDLVFLCSMGSPCMRYNAERVINNLVKEINLAECYEAKKEGREPVLMEDVYPHALRHTFASICYQADVDKKVCQKLMGHASYSTTIDIYTHISKAFIEDDIQKINDLKFPDLKSA